MAEVLRVAIVDPQDDTRNAMRDALLNGGEHIWLEAECQSYDVFQQLVERTLPDIGIIGIDSDPGNAVSLVQTLASRCPSVKIVVASAERDVNFVLGVMRRGAKDVVPLPLDKVGLVEVLENLGIDDPERKKRRVGARVLAFTGVRGGVGCTSLAINVGWIWAQAEFQNVVLVDLDLVTGDADVCLDVIPDFTLMDMALQIEKVDKMWIDRALCTHEPSKLRLLPHPLSLQESGTLESQQVDRVINLLRRNFTHILLDLSKGFSSIDFTAMNLADEIVVVMQPDLHSINNVIRLIKSLDEGWPTLSAKLRLVANRVGAEGSIPMARAEEAIGRPIAFQIPNDSRTMMGLRNSNSTLAKFAARSKLCLAVTSMANALVSAASSTAYSPSSNSGPKGGSGVSWPFGKR